MSSMMPTVEEASRLRREALIATVAALLLIGGLGILLQRWVRDGGIGTWAIRALLLILIMGSLSARLRSWFRIGRRNEHRWIPPVPQSAETSSGQSL
jgi:hypothetical protein